MTAHATPKLKKRPRRLRPVRAGELKGPPLLLGDAFIRTRPPSPATRPRQHVHGRPGTGDCSASAFHPNGPGRDHRRLFVDQVAGRAVWSRKRWSASHSEGEYRGHPADPTRRPQYLYGAWWRDRVAPRTAQRCHGEGVLTDTLHNTFDGLIGTVYKQIDFQVRGVAQFPTSNAANAVRNPVSESLLTTVLHVPGVEGADGAVSGYAQFVAPDGRPISNNSEGNLGISFDPNPKISELRIVEGEPPTTSGDVVMDAATAKKYHFRVGQQVRVLTDGPERTFTISGIAQYGTADTLAGITLAAFDLPTAQQISDEVGQFDTIDVITSPGANKASVQRAIAQVVPPGAEVVTGQTVQNEQTSSVDKALSFFSTALLVFALIALFVGAFTIFNTFSIIVGQRTRELALLRVVGASRRQLFRSVLAEAAVVGAVSSLIGVGLGVLAAIGIEALLRGFGITLPSGTLVFETRTVVVCLLVGIGVTVVSAVGPARRAVRIPPVAALREGQSESDVSPRRRFVVGGALALVGALLIGAGLAAPAYPSASAPWGSSSAWPCSPPPSPAPSPAPSAAPWPAPWGRPASWAERTPCAAPAAPPRPRQRSWWAWPWCRPSPSTGRQPRSRPPAASTTP